MQWVIGVHMCPHQGPAGTPAEKRGFAMMTKLTNRFSLLTTAAVAIFAFGTAVPAYGDGNGANLSAEWWQNAVSVPAPQNPILDESGTYCAIGQRGDTWFLYGSYGNAIGDPITRECSVPTGRQFLVPIVNVLCTPFEGETVEENVKLCKDFIDMVDMTALTVDGVDRSKLIKRYGASNKFSTVFPDDNYLGYPAGIYFSVADGYYAQLPPLAVGAHTIHLQGAISAYDFSVDVIYHINVVEPGVVIFP
jgi:hypothetical protein